MPGYFIVSIHVYFRSALLILWVVVASGCATTHPDIIPEKGFRDMSWGTPMAEIGGMTILERGGGRWKCGIRDSEQLNIGGVDVESITYIFIDHAFAGIDVTFGGQAAFGHLIRKLEKTLGQPTVVNKNMKMVAWKQDATTVLLRYYTRQNYGTLKYMSDNMAAQ